MIHAWPMWNAALEDGRLALASAGEFVREWLDLDPAPYLAFSEWPLRGSTMVNSVNCPARSRPRCGRHAV